MKKKPQPQQRIVHPQPEADDSAHHRPVTDEDLGHTRVILREVCSLASAAMDVARDPFAVGDDFDGLYSRIRVLQLIVDRMGWVADVGLRKLGDSGSLSRAEDWMLPGV